jgi:hypothetical protein
MSTSIFASDIHRRQATATTVLRSYAEYVKKQQYVSCAGTGAYGASAHTGLNSTNLSVPSGYVGTATAVAHWDGAAYSSRTTGSSVVTTGCTDQGTQLVSIQVSDSAGRDSETVDVVTRSS